MRYVVALVLLLANVAHAQTAAEYRAIVKAQRAAAEQADKTVRAGAIITASPAESLETNTDFLEQCQKATPGVVKELTAEISKGATQLSQMKRGTVSAKAAAIAQRPGVYAFPDKQTKEVMVKAKEAEIKGLKDRLADLKAGKRAPVWSIFFSNNQTLKPGMIGTFFMPFPVEQVVSNRELLCSYTDDWFLVRGIDTSNLSDGSYLDAPYVFEVTGTQSYAARSGQRTVMVVEPIGTVAEVEKRVAKALKAKK